MESATNLQSFTDYDWNTFRFHQTNLASIPTNPGIALTRNEEGLETCFLILDLNAWFKENRSSFSNSLTEARPLQVKWCIPTTEQFKSLLANETDMSALMSGKPKIVQDYRSAPETWGLYRIHQKDSDTWYVGISSNLRARLNSHMNKGLFRPDLGDSAELIRAKASSAGQIVNWSQLQKAETEHIQRLKTKSGKTVVNVTAGGNGRPPDFRHFLSQSSLQLSVGTYNPIKVTERKRHVDLQIQISAENEDWDLWFRNDLAICAVPGTHGEVSTKEEFIDWQDIKDLYLQRHGRNLDDDLISAGCPVPTGEIVRYYWNHAQTKTFDELFVLDPRDFIDVGSEDLKNHDFSRVSLGQNFYVDNKKVRGSTLKPVIRLTADKSSGVWLKQEASPQAVRAEYVVSALLARLQWPGIGHRARISSDGKLIITHDLGTDAIEDRGPIRGNLTLVNFESPETLCHHPRANQVLRVHSYDLRLFNPLSALHLLLFDAVICNTDRRSGNLHIGRDVHMSEFANSQYLLPLDHGRSIFNAAGEGRNQSRITPIQAITGESPEGIPNQLLRYVHGMCQGDISKMVESGNDFLLRLTTACRSLSEGFADYQNELEFILSNIFDVQEDLFGFYEMIFEGVN